MLKSLWWCFRGVLETCRFGLLDFSKPRAYISRYRYLKRTFLRTTESFSEATSFSAGHPFLTLSFQPLDILMVLYLQL
jgi:hypothetical protein